MIHTVDGQNLEGVLKGAGLTFRDVAKANIYLTDLSKDFNAVNEVRRIHSHPIGSC